MSEREEIFLVGIEDEDELWVRPTYERGEVWEMHGGGPAVEYEILDLFKDSRQVLTIDSNGRRHLFPIDSFGYGRSGTPSLRRRIR